MAECQLPKLSARVRFPSLAPGYKMNRPKTKNFRPYWEVFGLWSLVFGLFLFSGCATVRTVDEYPVKGSSSSSQQVKIYHAVKHGETLWRIAKTYGIPIEDIIKANHLKPNSAIEDKQKIFIPGAETTKQVFLDEDHNKNDFIWPIEGDVIHYFHERHHGEVNQGIDIRAEPGEVVRAARTGRVVFADYLPGYGSMVILDHEDGLYTIYSENADIKVKLGDLVVKNTEIAQIGGKDTLAYLHFEIRKKNIEDNPIYYLP